MMTATEHRPEPIAVEDWCQRCLGGGVIWTHPKNQAIEKAEICPTCNGTGRRKA